MLQAFRRLLNGPGAPHRDHWRASDQAVDPAHQFLFLEEIRQKRGRELVHSAAARSQPAAELSGALVRATATLAPDHSSTALAIGRTLTLDEAVALAQSLVI